MSRKKNKNGRLVLSVNAVIIYVYIKRTPLSSTKIYEINCKQKINPSSSVKRHFDDTNIPQIYKFLFQTSISYKNIKV